MSQTLRARLAVHSPSGEKYSVRMSEGRDGPNMSKMPGAKPPRKMGRPPTLDDPRAHILKVSAKFFSEQGFEKSSLSKLAAGMKMSKAFIYHYFSTKEQLIEEITIDTQHRLLASTRARLATSDSYAEKVRLFMVEHAEFLDDNFHEMRTANYSFAGHMSGQIEVLARQNNSDYLAVIVEIFREGSRRGELVCDDPAVSGRAIFSLIHSLSRWYRPGSAKPAAAYADEFFQIFARGILPAKTDNVTA